MSRRSLEVLDPNPGSRSRAVFYYVYLACLFGANAVALMPARNFGQSGSNTLFTASWIGLGGFSILFLLGTIRRSPRTLIFSLVVGLYVVGSTMWSVAPSSSLIYGSLLAINILTAHLMAADLGVDKAMRMVGQTILALCIGGIVAYAAGFAQVYYFDIHGRPNILGGQPFRGFFVHKITAGLYASLGAVWAVFMLRGWRRLASLAVFALTVALTSSATGIALLLIAVGFSTVTYAALKRGMSRFAFFTTLTVAMGAAVALLTVNWTGLLGALGRDVTLTGRTDLWLFGIDTFAKRPVYGWGFNAYFDSPESLWLRVRVPAFQNYEVPHFHQSYIQTAVDLGLPAVLLVVGLLGYVLLRSYRLAIQTKSFAAGMIFAATLVMVVASMVMHVFLTYNHFVTFALFFFAYLVSGANSRSPGDSIARRPGASRNEGRAGTTPSDIFT